MLKPENSGMFSRRCVLAAFGTGFALAKVAVSSPAAAALSQSQLAGASPMQQSAVNEAVRAGGLLVVAQWEAKQGEADKVADILRGFMPLAQREPGVKLFLIGQGKDNPAQFLFYELFADDAAFAAHQASDHFKTLIAGEALPRLAKRERAQYVLL
jgi:quinol monooxygenase YgiN